MMARTDLFRPEDLPAQVYFSPNYLSRRRLTSFAIQYELAMNSGGTTFLEIGQGAGIVTYLLHRSGKRIFTIDINSQLLPTLVSALPGLPFRSNSFDTVLCFEVLEHLPINLLNLCLRELSRMTTRSVIISVPNQEVFRQRNELRIVRLKRIVKSILKGKGNTKHRNAIADGHYWEIGYQGVTSTDIIDSARKARLTLKTEFRNEFLPYHHFFVFELSDPG